MRCDGGHTSVMTASTSVCKAWDLCFKSLETQFLFFGNSSVVEYDVFYTVAKFCTFLPM